MSDTNLKNIAIHLSEKVQNNLVDLLRHINSQGELEQGSQLVLTEVAPDGDEGSASKDSREAKEQAKKADPSKLGDSQSDEIVRETSKGKSYEKLLFQGNKTETKGKEQQLLEILNEVEGGEELSQKGTLKSLHNPAPVPNTEFDEKFLEALDEELESDEESEFEGDGDEKGDDEGDEEDTSSVKETNPGYFKSILTKI